MTLICRVVADANSSAAMSPRTETARAANFSVKGIVATGVFSGRILEEMISPAAMLPRARRLIGLIKWGSFSLMGEIELNRGCPMQTKKTTRRL